ncbi:MAG: hypothetical protein ABGW88_18000 [Leeuwenhoekiella sp.]|uniref:hypothetical protein n=1 Tax=Leeuwenhoekiella TaxID=283735 RepID=UPI000ED6E7CD|nr:hypothetical protein [Leeuwenhoekiella blandensis]HCW65444.1 hypothetical protein [Leeuwenhoekiella sp.]|tara:strand:- start:970 stop:1656 length:687 start_codon:yes stop_codon:yes gene_type:complete
MQQKYLIGVLCFFCSVTIHAQVGIGTSSPSATSILDISASDKGLLIPRVALTGTDDESTIDHPVESLLVYNTATVSDVTPGYYYWDGTRWYAMKQEHQSGSENTRGIEIIRDPSTSFSQNNSTYNNRYVFDISAYPTKSVFLFRKNNTGVQSLIQFAGIKGGTDGRVITIMNAEKQFRFQFQNSSDGAAAKARFNIEQNIDMNAEGYHSATFIYDGSSSRWLLLNRSY